MSETTDFKYLPPAESLRPNDDPNKQAVKFDHGKLRWSLIPWDSVRAILNILEVGAKKYAPRNWEQGMDWSRPFDACIRHLTAWWNGEGKDPDTGYSHLWHAGCNILFLIAYELRGVGKDDRPKRSDA
jgi:Domain of unknown function (DUF5664)